MKHVRVRYLALVMGAVAMCSTGAFALTAKDLHKDADQALHRLTSTTPLAAALSKKAKAVLIFPNIVKAGLIFGGVYGEGVMKQGAKIAGSSTLKDEAYAFIFDQQGLMASLSIEGTKISHIKTP